MGKGATYAIRAVWIDFGREVTWRFNWGSPALRENTQEGS